FKMGEELLYVQFNQDFTSLGVGTNNGWALVSVSTPDNLERIHEQAATDGVQIVERLFSSSLVAIVSLQSPRKLRVCHFKKNNEICNYSYANTILAVRLNRARLVVCLEEMLYIHNIRDMKILHTIRDTPQNPKGLLALSVNADNSYLAYPGSASTGQVQVFDAFNLQAKIVIHAHASPLAALAFNMSGSLLATASQKGTVIRVFNTNSGNRLYEFRRGMKRCASIYSIAFSSDDAFLAVSSNTGFSDWKPLLKEETPTPTASWMEWVKSSLPSQVTRFGLKDERLPQLQHLFMTVAVTTVPGSEEGKVRVLVASYDGFLYIYGLNTQEGGECPLLKQHKLVGETDVRKSPSSAGTASYAGIVKGRSPQCMSDSDKMAEMRNAVAQPSEASVDFPALDK
ncbi:WD repeat domain phosphoinositide-interacting protein 2, partial [Orchesella cincta]